jgi:hypothetical protein
MGAKAACKVENGPTRTDHAGTNDCDSSYRLSQVCLLLAEVGTTSAVAVDIQLTEGSND